MSSLCSNAEVLLPCQESVLTLSADSDLFLLKLRVTFIVSFGTYVSFGNLFIFILVVSS